MSKTELNAEIFSNIKVEEDLDENEVIDENNLSRTIMDFSISLPTRITALNMYYIKEGGDNTIEILNKLSTMYELSGVQSLRKYLYAICEGSEIEPFLKSIIAKSLWSFDKNDDYGYKCVEKIYPLLDHTIGTPYKIDFVKILMNNDLYREKAATYFNQIIDNMKLDIDYRYKTILSLEDKEEKDEKQIDRIKYFIKQACLTFIKNNNNTIKYRILSGQNLLTNHKLSENEKENVESILFSFANDEKVEYNTRADASDVILQSGTEKGQNEARQIIMKLGKIDRKETTIYNNAQNVHSKEIEDSVKEALEFLQNFSLMKVKDKPITFEYVEEEIINLVQKTDIEDKVKVSLNRIYMDRALYSKYNCTLSHILLQIWTYLSGHKNQSEITGRLLEELCEMSGTCSSGFATRLINTISGFGDFSVKISWREQIIANLSGRLNARIRNMDNLRLQEKIVEEMTIPSGEYELRKNFLKFFRKNILSIREELHNEFTQHISDVDFDLYFRSAISMYENGEF